MILDDDELQDEYDEVIFPTLLSRKRARRYGVGGKDTTAPTLTLPLDLPLSDVTGYLGVTTDNAGGTLYYVVTTSATPPTKAQVKAGEDHASTAATFAGSQAISSTGAKTDTATGLSPNTAYYAYFMHEDAAANQSSVSAANGFTTLTTGTSDTSFDTLIAAMTGAPTDLRKGYIAQCIQALYAGGAWAQLDTLWVAAAHDSQAATLNWIAPASFTLVPTNSPTFTADRGWTTNGTDSWLATGWDPSTNGVNYQRNDANLAVYSLADTSGSNNLDFGSETGSPAQSGIRGRAGTGAASRINNTAIGVACTGAAALPLHLMAMRSVSTDHTIWRDGVQNNTIADASVAPNTVDFAIGKTAGVFIGRQVAAHHLGGALTTDEGLALYNALHTYMVAVGADT